MPHVFISYVREDQKAVERLCNALRSEGINVWLDKNDIAPGSRWRQAISDAIQKGDYFIACFSNNYSSRERTYMNEELVIAIEELRKRPTDRTWFIPTLLSECNIPNRPIGAGETLLDIQQVHLYESWERGIRQIISVISPKARTKKVSTAKAKRDLGRLKSQMKHERMDPATARVLYALWDLDDSLEPTVDKIARTFGFPKRAVQDTIKQIKQLTENYLVTIVTLSQGNRRYGYRLNREYIITRPETAFVILQLCKLVQERPNVTLDQFEEHLKTTSALDAKLILDYIGLAIAAGYIEVIKSTTGLTLLNPSRRSYYEVPYLELIAWRQLRQAAPRS